MSLPAWGAWIETLIRLEQAESTASLPAWGAWIETCSETTCSRTASRRSPRGERGLKPDTSILVSWGASSLPAWGAWIETFRENSYWVRVDVAPRVGSVD